jgi:crotonobetainyl-CoA:carnitine CoA-transferase CaiB-like acyl-CoA transferase
MTQDAQTNTAESSTPAATSALEGLRVVELGDFIAAAYAGKVLADLGAEVIKVEPPSGDSARQHGPFPEGEPHPEKSGLFLYLNANKLGATLDPATATGKELLAQLLEQSDILLTDLELAELTELELMPDNLAERHPALITIAISTFGHDGPLRDHRGADIVSAAMGGMNDTVGEPGRAPLVMPGYQSHSQAGAHAAAAALTALFGRELTGRGQYIDIAESDIWASFNQPGRAHIFVHEGRVRRRAGHRTMGVYPYTVLPVRDGYISMIAGRGRQWKSFLELMGEGEVPAWYSEDERFADRLKISQLYADEMDELIAPWLMAHDKDEIFHAAQERGIPFAPVYTTEEVVTNEHLRARGYFETIDHPVAGEFEYPGAPYVLSETPCEVQRPAPLLGEHNDEVWGERVGMQPDELSTMRRNGII